MSKIKTLIQLEFDRRLALEIADQHYSEAKQLQKEIDVLLKDAREECGRTGETIYGYFGVEDIENECTTNER